MSYLFSGSYSRLFSCCSSKTCLNSAHWCLNCAMGPRSIFQVLTLTVCLCCIPPGCHNGISVQTHRLHTLLLWKFCIPSGSKEVYQGKIISGETGYTKRIFTRTQTVQQSNLLRSPNKFRFCRFFLCWLALLKFRYDYFKSEAILSQFFMIIKKMGWHFFIMIPGLLSSFKPGSIGF